LQRVRENENKVVLSASTVPADEQKASRKCH
jgi:hypothetical protein